ncbi:MAG: Uma2 family endonuclease [Planctomycetes bacterium]|nr:Uma2 family endonuclease [Planctomycetota bacterium]
MNSSALLASTDETLDDLMERLGSVPLSRIRLSPPPGTATERDVIAVHDRTDRLCELVDGVLVEKPMGFYESRLAAALIEILGQYLSSHDMGIVLSSDGMVRLSPGLVRIPDVSFLAWNHFPNRELPSEAIPALAPDLAVEILSAGNTDAEMTRKLREYFEAGVRMVWYLHPKTRVVEVFRGLDQRIVVAESGVLDGGEVLPGFSLRLNDWFAKAGRQRTA